MTWVRQDAAKAAKLLRRQVLADGRPFEQAYRDEGLTFTEADVERITVVGNEVHVHYRRGFWQLYWPFSRRQWKYAGQRSSGVWRNTSARDRGREGGAASGALRRDRILQRFAHLPVDLRTLAAYKLGYQAGYQTAKKRYTKGEGRDGAALARTHAKEPAYRRWRGGAGPAPGQSPELARAPD